MNISKVEPQNNFTLHILADDGRTGIFDVSPYLKDEAFTDLQDKNKFKQILNGKYFIEWDCGADLSADTIEANWDIVSN